MLLLSTESGCVCTSNHLLSVKVASHTRDNSGVFVCMASDIEWMICKRERGIEPHMVVVDLFTSSAMHGLKLYLTHSSLPVWGAITE